MLAKEEFDRIATLSCSKDQTMGRLEQHFRKQYWRVCSSVALKAREPNNAYAPSNHYWGPINDRDGAVVGGTAFGE